MASTRVPWATWQPLGSSGGSLSGSARKITLHTMECTCWPRYSEGRSAPHLSVNPANGEARQHIELDEAGRALASPGAPRSPNRNAGVNIQIEIQGYAKDTAGYPEAWYRQLAQWLDWLCEEWDVPRTFPFDFGGEEGYGTSGRYRVSWGTFASTSGIVGHSNVPGNSHWDPGRLDQARLLDLMEASAKPVPGVTVPGGTVPGEERPVASTYTVQSGDTLGEIASRHDLTLAEILERNPSISNPNLIHPGQQVLVGPRTTPYIVVRGDTLGQIATRHGCTLAELLDLNPDITDPDLIHVGQRVLVPVSG